MKVVNHKNLDLTEEQKDLVRKLHSETGLNLVRCMWCLQHYNWDYNESKSNYKKYEWDRKLY